MTKLAILSDTHDNIWNLDMALAQMRAQGCAALLHCGDLCAPFIVKQLAEGFAGPIHLIFGNNEGDGRLIQVVTSQFAHVTHHGIYAEIEMSGRKIAAIHYPQPALRIAQSGQFDLVCYGHDHAKHIETIGPTLFVNPGEILGKDHPATWGLYDCASRRFEFVSLAGGMGGR